MTQKLLLAWQHPASGRWLVVGLLEKDHDVYTFRYSQSAKEAAQKGEFIPFGVMHDLNKIYRAKELFPLFKNRLLAKSRPEYKDYFKWLGLELAHASDMDELASFGGIRATDHLQLFPYPENSQGEYRVKFFVRGLRHMAKEAIQRVAELKYGDKLALMQDLQNKYDAMALAIRTNEPPVLVGYCPRYFVEDFIRLLKEPDKVLLSVVQVNPIAPLQYRLRCQLIAPWREDFATFADKEFQLNPHEPLSVAI